MANSYFTKPPNLQPQPTRKKLCCIKAVSDKGALCFKWTSVDCILQTENGALLVRVAGENYKVNTSENSVDVDELFALWEQALNG